MLIDTHCHLPSLTHKPLEQILADAQAAGVTRMVCIGAADGIDSARAAVALAEQYDNVWASVGVHPHDAGNFTEVTELEQYLAHDRVVAIGETGLDFFKEWAPFPEQRMLFRNSIAMAKNCGKPLIIHCRDAHAETLATLEECGAAAVGGVFHCYAEDEEFAKKLRDINFLVSLTGILTFKNAAKLRAAVRNIPLEQIMLETDCPYMAPEPHRGKPAEPSHVRIIAETLAAVHETSVEHVARVTTATAERFFSLPPAQAS